MSRDYASKKSTSKTGGKARRKPAAATRNAKSTGGNRTIVSFGAGTAFGVFLSFLAWLAIQPPGEAPVPSAEAPVVETEKEPSAEPRFEFWTRLPGEDMAFPEEEAEFGENVVSEYRNYLLQTGSFRQREDADRRRAQLILLGMDATISETHGDTGMWYRVQVGPFESRRKLEQARSVLAQENIDTLLLRRSD